MFAALQVIFTPLLVIDIQQPRYLGRKEPMAQTRVGPIPVTGTGIRDDAFDRKMLGAFLHGL